MRDRALLVIMVLGMLLMGSCRSHKRLVGSDGHVIPDQVTNVAKPDLTGNADNNYTRALVDEAYAWLGTPYKWGGETRQGADCSGFTMQVYDKALGIKLPRVSRDQGEAVKQARISDLMVGDLLFFVTGNNGKVSHVGIYLGDNKMIHSSSSKGVCVSDLSNKYWSDHFHHSGYVEEYRKQTTAKNKKSPSKQTSRPATTSQQTTAATAPESTPTTATNQRTPASSTTGSIPVGTTTHQQTNVPSATPQKSESTVIPQRPETSKKSRVKRY